MAQEVFFDEDIDLHGVSLSDDTQERQSYQLRVELRPQRQAQGGSFQCAQNQRSIWTTVTPQKSTQNPTSKAAHCETDSEEFHLHTKSH